MSHPNPGMPLADLAEQSIGDGEISANPPKLVSIMSTHSDQAVFGTNM